jgi:hypothetical protein
MEHEHHDHYGHPEHIHGPGCGHIDVHESGLCAIGICGHLEHMRQAWSGEMQDALNNLNNNEKDEFGIKKKKLKKRKQWALFSANLHK